MPFKTDGSSHATGVANEHSVCEFLQNRSTVLRAFFCPAGETVRHVGGTRTKKDAEIVDAAGAVKGISVKNHSGKGGTFDWVNTSKEVPATLKSTLKTELAAIKKGFQETARTEQDVIETGATIDALLAKHLRETPEEVIRALLKKTYAECPPYILIHDAKRKEFIAAERSKNLKELATYDDWAYFTRSESETTTSVQIWRRGPDGTEVNTSLRLRLRLNNGVHALLGVKKTETSKNTSAIPTYKIQQDAVDKFIETLVDPVRESYSELT